MNKFEYVRMAVQVRGHECHWPGCRLQVPPAKWGCAKHWFRLPEQIRAAIWAAYRPGQEIDKRPSAAYMQAAAQAQAWIASHASAASQAANAAAAGEMLAISLRQPWAWLCLHAGKDIENRSWPTDVRGRVLVHAAKGMTPEELASALRFAHEHCGVPLGTLQQACQPDQLRRGGIVGSVEIVDCVAHHNSRWFVGPYGFVLRDPRPLEFVPRRGELKFFRVSLPSGGDLVRPTDCPARTSAPEPRASADLFDYPVG